MPDKNTQFQFSVLGLLLFTLAVACSLALLVVAPAMIAVPGIIFLAVAVPAVLTVGIVHGHGAMRTFCIGALFPTGALLYCSSWMFVLALVEPDEFASFSDWLEFSENVGHPFRVYAGTAWILSVIVGCICVGARRLLQR